MNKIVSKEIILLHKAKEASPLNLPLSFTLPDFVRRPLLYADMIGKVYAIYSKPRF